MRIGLIADIHGNYCAMETVVQELIQEAVDQVVCLGDVGSLGPEPHEVLEWLRTVRCPTVLGNTDEWLLIPPVADASDSQNTHIMYEINAWCAEQLTPEDRSFLQDMPSLLELELGGGRTLLGYHGSPSSFDDIIAAVTPDAVVEEMLDGHSASVMVGGHTHIQMVRRYKDSFLINTGSVGLPGVNAGGKELTKNNDVHWAEYAILGVEGDRLSIDLRRMDLDLPALFSAARGSDMPNLDWWLQKWRQI